MDNLGRDMMIMMYVFIGIAALLGCAVGGAVVYWLTRGHA